MSTWTDRQTDGCMDRWKEGKKKGYMIEGRVNEDSRLSFFFLSLKRWKGNNVFTRASIFSILQVK